MKPVLVAVVCSEQSAALLAHHRDFSVVWAAQNGTSRPAVERAPSGDDSETVAMLMDYREVAAALSLSERKVRQLVTDGELFAVSVGSARRIRRSDLERYVEHLGEFNQPEGTDE